MSFPIVLLSSVITHAVAAQAIESHAPLAPLTAVEHYAPVFQSCENAAHEKRLALRVMRIGGVARKLLVDQQTLQTSVADAAGWSCTDTSDDSQAQTRFLQALKKAAQPAPIEARILRDEGLLHGEGGGTFLTGDLCPSHRPLDRDFLAMLPHGSAPAPIALSLSGLWLLHHTEDFRWLQSEMRAGRLAITWVNHSFDHPFNPFRPLAQDFLLRPGIDIMREVLDTERLLIAQGETPSAFFRFPGLVADATSLESVSRLHLITLGTDSWLALSPPPRPGSIVLVHPNGNEPVGLRLFARYLAAGKLALPFRPITEAP